MSRLEREIGTPSISDRTQMHRNVATLINPILQYRVCMGGSPAPENKKIIRLIINRCKGAPQTYRNVNDDDTSS